jgi:hypothetical protein
MKAARLYCPRNSERLIPFIACHNNLRQYQGLGNGDNPATPAELEKIVIKTREKIPDVVQSEHEKIKAVELKGNVPIRNETADELFGSHEPNARKYKQILKLRTTSHTDRRQRSCRRSFQSSHKASQHFTSQRYTWTEYLYWLVNSKVFSQA